MNDEKINASDILAPVYGSRWDTLTVPKNEIPSYSMREDQAYQIISDEKKWLDF